MRNKIGVVGAGMMGAEIALCFALVGNDVLLNDRDQEGLDRALERLRTIMEKGVKRDFYKAEDVEPTLARIKTTTNIADFADREFVTEAVFEEVEVKSAVLKALDEICSADCIFASNTSTIPISTLAGLVSSERQANFIGTHYFSPVSRMKLVEVIPGFKTNEDVVAATMELMTSIGKAPVRVKDVTGFLINRVLHMFFIEAIKLVEEGVATPEDIDTACRLGLGHPIGPFALMDVTKLSLGLQAQEIMHEAYGERFRPPALLKQMVRAGYVGGKGNPGWLSDEV